MEGRRRAETASEFDLIRQGWCRGSEALRQKLLARANQLASPRHAGEEIRENDLAKAERLLEEELGRLHWTAEDLRRRRKGDPRKVQIAARLRHEITVTLAWMAERPQMGAPIHLTCLLHRQRKDRNSEITFF